MRREKKIRIYIAWVLIMALTPFFVVKTFHHHGSGETTSCSHSDTTHNPCNDCAVCHFSLSFFTQPQPVNFHPILTLIPYEPFTSQDKIVCERTYSHQLRAPPVA